jgi:high-affinity iron transporter
MASTFLIALREGLEAALIIGILVAYVKRSNRGSALTQIWIGVGAAIVVSLGFGAFLTFTSSQLTDKGEMVFAGVTSVVATALVSLMVFWMKRTARTIKGELESKVETALPLGGLALMSAAFFAVVREGLETALFLFSNFKTVSKDFGPSLGLILGLIAAVLLGVAIYRRSIRINLSKFFAITGTALLVIAGGVLAHGVREFQDLGILPGDHSFSWHLNNPNNIIESFLSGTVGISTDVTWLQLGVWAVYLGLILPLFLAPASSAKSQVLAQISAK